MATKHKAVKLLLKDLVCANKNVSKTIAFRGKKVPGTVFRIIPLM